MQTQNSARQFACFLVCGGLASVVNISVRWALTFVIPYSVSIVVAFLCGLFTGFLLFKYVVFKSTLTKNILAEGSKYILVNAFALLQTLVISIGLADYIFPRMGMCFYPYDIAHITGVLFPVVSSFLFHKYFTFKSGNMPCV